MCYIPAFLQNAGIHFVTLTSIIVAVGADCILDSTVRRVSNKIFLAIRVSCTACTIFQLSSMSRNFDF